MKDKDIAVYKLRITFFTILVYSSITSAAISNLIVFGDSLSDGGNFPESSAIWWNPAAEKTVQNAVAQFYVPFSDPVDTAVKSSEIWPTLDNRYLSTQATIAGQSASRQYRSIGWSQFFLALAKTANLINTDIIAPSHLLATRSIPATYSFNYAWGYATSDQGCVNPYYQQNASCNVKSISRARAQYIENPSTENYRHLEIPGLFQQIQSFIQDQRDHKVTVNNNTLYVFWTGGNDLIIANNALLNKYNPWPAIQFLSGSTASHVITNIKTLLRALPEQSKPAHIYVFTLFNPALTPAYYGSKIGPVGNFAVKMANFWFSVRATLFNLFSPTKIVIVPIYDFYQKNSKAPIFNTHLGKTCQLDGGDFTSATVIPKTNCAGFMFWNAVHPATPMQIETAKRFFTGSFASTH